MSTRNDQHIFMTNTERLEAELREVRASHDALLAAAKEMIIAVNAGKHVISCGIDLQAAIAKAEKLAS